MPELKLYYFEACPFCQIVLRAIEELALEVTFCDISQSQEHLNKLVQDTGRRTVPCLYIDENPMHESRDIIIWLQDSQDKLKKKGS